MHAVRLHAFGPAENLVHERVPDPLPPADHLRPGLSYRRKAKESGPDQQSVAITTVAATSPLHRTK